VRLVIVWVSMGLRSLVGVIALAIAGLVSLLFGVLALLEPESARSGTGDGKPSLRTLARAGLVSLLFGVLALSDGELCRSSGDRSLRSGAGEGGLSIDPDRNLLDPDDCRSGTGGGKPSPSLVTRTRTRAGLVSLLLGVLAMEGYLSIDPDLTLASAGLASRLFGVLVLESPAPPRKAGLVSLLLILNWPLPHTTFFPSSHACLVPADFSNKFN
jgi:hypothetical protein